MDIPQCVALSALVSSITVGDSVPDYSLGTPFAYTTNNAGGYIVLTDAPCQQTIGENGGKAFTFVEGGEKFEGCASYNVQEKSITIEWKTPDEIHTVKYNMDVFQMIPREKKLEV